MARSTSRLRPLTALLWLACFSLAGAADAQAQSLLGYRALGVPVWPIDGRGVAVGSLGIGLAGVGLSATDPTVAADLVFPTVSASMQPTWGEYTLDGRTQTTNTTRFPLIAVGYPVLSVNGTATFSLAGFMEQRWVAEFPTFNELGGVIVPTEDRFESNGGSSIARLGWSQRLGDRASVGFTAGRYLGRLDQVFGRTLDSLTVGGNVQPFIDGGSWRYTGSILTVGASVDPYELLHVAAALEWSSDLEATPQGDTGGEVKAFQVPLKLSAGATADLTSRLALNVSMVMQDWSGADGFEAGTTSGTALSYGAGVEWHAFRFLNRSFPFRFGYRRVALPFRFEAEDPLESAWTMGVGLNLVEAEGLRFGWIDLGLERGRRSSGPLDERFWRGIVSLGISRF